MLSRGVWSLPNIGGCCVHFNFDFAFFLLSYFYLFTFLMHMLFSFLHLKKMNWSLRL